MKTIKNLKRGFTLIELLVVIAIIGILSSVVLASLNSARAKARDAKRLSDIKSLQFALELYFDQNKEYPSQLIWSGNESLGEYISSEPKDPLGANYKYEACGTDNDGYHLGASLEQQLSSALNDNNNSNNAQGNCPAGWGLNTSPCVGTAGVQQGSYCYDVTD